MPERRPKDQAPDLFAAAVGKAPPPEEQPNVRPTEAMPTGQSRRHLLPKDLPAALTRLDDNEIDALVAAVMDEAKRRGRLPQGVTATTATKPPEPDRPANEAPGEKTRARPLPPRSGQPPAGDKATSLPIGKANAFRAAFKAGVKPSTIARQFGISQSIVRQVLATEVRKPRS